MSSFNLSLHTKEHIYIYVVPVTNYFFLFLHIAEWAFCSRKIYFAGTHIEIFMSLTEGIYSFAKTMKLIKNKRGGGTLSTEKGKRKWKTGEAPYILQTYGFAFGCSSLDMGSKIPNANEKESIIEQS